MHSKFVFQRSIGEDVRRQIPTKSRQEEASSPSDRGAKVNMDAWTCKEV